MHQSVFELPRILHSIRKNSNTLSIGKIIFPFALVAGTVRVCRLTLSTAPTILKLADILFFVRICDLALAVGDIILPLPDIFTSVKCFKGPLTLPHASNKFPGVFEFPSSRKGPHAIRFVIMPFAIVLGAIRKSHDSLAGSDSFLEFPHIFSPVRQDNCSLAVGTITLDAKRFSNLGRNQ